MSTRLLLVRHGESVWNAEQRLQGQADPPLSAGGTAQARLLATRLSPRPLAALYCSPLGRARATAAAIGGPHGLTPHVVEAVQEVHLGAWQGHTLADLSAEARVAYRRWCVTPVGVRPPGGETLDEAVQRCGPAVDALLAAHQGATLVLVTHSIIGRVLLCHLLGMGLELVPRLKLKPASISLLRLDDGRAVLEQLSDVSHLRPLPQVRHVATDGVSVEVQR